MARLINFDLAKANIMTRRYEGSENDDMEWIAFNICHELNLMLQAPGWQFDEFSFSDYLTVIADSVV